jgi:hypothetical protein
MSYKSNVNIPLLVGLFQTMAYMDGYDYSGMSHFIEEFCNPFADRMEENYGMLWQFKDCVD